MTLKTIITRSWGYRYEWRLVSRREWLKRRGRWVVQIRRYWFCKAWFLGIPLGEIKSWEPASKGRWAARRKLPVGYLYGLTRGNHDSAEHDSFAHQSGVSGAGSL